MSLFFLTRGHSSIALILQSNEWIQQNVQNCVGYYWNVNNHDAFKLVSSLSSKKINIYTTSHKDVNILPKITKHVIVLLVLSPEYILPYAKKWKCFLAWLPHTNFWLACKAMWVCNGGICPSLSVNKMLVFYIELYSANSGDSFCFGDMMDVDDDYILWEWFLLPLGGDLKIF